MFNYYLRATAAQGATVKQYDYLPALNGQPASITERNIIASADGALTHRNLDGSVTTDSFSVSGHSLGGHLAMLLSRLVPGAATSVSTFNAPGFGTEGQIALSFFDPLIQAMTVQSQIGAGWNTQIMAHLNIEGDVVHTLGATPAVAGLANIMFSESTNQGWIDAHSMEAITDSLAVYNLLATLDPALNTDPNGLTRITNILKASSNVAANSLESAVSSLGKLFLVSGAARFNSNEFDSNRDLLYVALNDIAAALPAGLSLVAVDAATILADAKAATPDALASRYALVNGNPFVVKGADYGIHNNNGELDLFDPATHSGSLTNHYLTDRANYLKWQLQANVADKSVLIGTTAPNDWQYTDQTIHGSLTVKGGLMASLSPARQIIFGSDFNDDGSSSLSPVLQGGTQDDRLYGMGGNDTLQGDGGNDHLEGGRGADTYVWNADDGLDTIRDTDGLGGIVVNGQTLGAGESKDGGRTYASTDAAGKRHTYTVLSGDINSAAGATLLIDNALEIFNYRAGDLGLTVGNAAPPQPLQTAPTTRDIVGDYGPMNFYDANGNVFRQYDDLGNLVTDPNKAGPRDDVLSDGAGNDHIYANTQTDTAAAIASGNDLLISGAGDDNILGDADYTPQFILETTTRYSVGGVNWYHTSAEPFNWTVTPQTDTTVFAPVTGAANPPDSGNDIIYAGDGADHVWAGDGAANDPMPLAA